MSKKTVISISDERRELPDQEKIADIASDAYAHTRTGAVKAIATVTLLNGNKVTTGAYIGLSGYDRAALIGALHRLADQIAAQDDRETFGHLPKD